jgi:FKBP-type peptidyl-prolyl cis-trans isomerase
MHRVLATPLLLVLTACPSSTPAASTPAEGSAPAAAEGTAAAPATGEGTAAAAEGTAPAAVPEVAQVEASNPLAPPSDVAAPPADAQVTASGLASRVIRAGTGTSHPAATSTVSVHYSGWTTDGELFDSSHRRRRPASFALNQVIAGWTEGVQLMVEGEVRRFWIPEALAYQGQPGAPAGMLVFDVELLDILEPPETPADVAAPPANAEVTASGLASVVLTPGTGTRNPSATSRVRVHYSGWTTDGNMFDSSVMRGEPAEFGLNQVIAGWTEGVQLMVEGEKRRFWIPVELAYNNRPGRPAGMLVFDVELLSILD